MCYYFDDIVKIEDTDFNNILIDEKLYESILTYNVSYKTLISGAPLRIRFYKVDGFIRVYDRTKYLASYCSEKFDAIYNRIRYLCHESVFSQN